MGGTVELPRWLVGVGGVALLAAFSSTAFLLGRSTAPPPVVVQAPSPTPAPPVVADAPPDTGLPAMAAVPEKADAPPTKTASITPSSKTTPPPAEPHDTGSADVRIYFQRLDRVGALDAAGVDPNTIVQQAMGGDVSGIDRLIEDHQKRQRAIAQIHPPAACARHHQMLTKLADDGLRVMQQLRNGIVKQDLNALMGLQSSAMRLQTLGDEVSRLEAELKQAHGA